MEAVRHDVPQEELNEYERSVLGKVFTLASTKIKDVLKSKGQRRNSEMAFGRLEDRNIEEDEIPHALLFSPLHAPNQEHSFEGRRKYTALLDTLADQAVQLVTEEIQRIEAPKELVRGYFKEQIDDNIRANYRFLWSKYDIFHAFSNGHLEPLTLKEVQREILRIRRSPQDGEKAFVDQIQDHTHNAYTGKELELLEPILRRIEAGRFIPTSELSRLLHNLDGVEQYTITSFTREYMQAVERWDAQLLRRMGIFGKAAERMEDEELLAEWGDAQLQVIEEIMNQITPFINKLKAFYKITELDEKGSPVEEDFLLSISSELRNISPMELFHYMTGELQPEESYLAQCILILTTQYLLAKHHPHYKGAPRQFRSLKFDSISEHATHYFSYIIKDQASGLWRLNENAPMASHVDESKISISSPTNGFDGMESQLVEEDTSLHGGGLRNLVDALNVLQPQKALRIDWRYWLSPEAGRKEKVIDPRGKEFRFHLVGQGIKSIESILPKLHMRRDHFEEIDDIVRAQIMLDMSKEELQNTEGMLPFIEKFAKDVAHNSLHLEHFMPGTAPEDLQPNSFTIEYNLDRMDDKNNHSSTLWRDIKIFGKSAQGVTVEIQLLPHDVYCLDLDIASPVAHEWYEIDRQIDFIQSLLPYIYYPRAHRLMNEIRERMQKHKAKATALLEEKMRTAQAA